MLSKFFVIHVDNFKPETSAKQKESSILRIKTLLSSAMPEVAPLIPGEYSRALIPGVKANQQVGTTISKLKTSLAKLIGESKNAEVVRVLGTVITDSVFPYHEPKTPGYVATIDHERPGRFKIKAVFSPSSSVFSQRLSLLCNYLEALVSSDAATIAVAINVCKWVGDELASAIRILHPSIRQRELDISMSLVVGGEFDPEDDVDIRFSAGTANSGAADSIKESEAFLKEWSSSRVDALKKYKNENTTSSSASSAWKAVKSVGRGVKNVVTDRFKDDKRRTVPVTRYLFSMV
jgi:hypothetical protein